MQPDFWQHDKDSTTDQSADHQEPEDQVYLVGGQDGAPSHTSASTSKFLKVRKVKVLQDWPVQSPDMNIIEHVWGKMKQEAWKMKPKSHDEHWKSCKTAFFAIPDDFIDKLSESLPRQMDAVLQAHGTHTWYLLFFPRRHDFMFWCYCSMFVYSK